MTTYTSTYTQYTPSTTMIVLENIPSIEEMTKDLAGWCKIADTIAHRAREAAKLVKEREDRKKDIPGWKYTSRKHTICNYDDCTGGDGFYSAEDSTHKFCSGCFPNRDEKIKLRTLYFKETPMKTIERSKNRAEWVFFPPEHDNGNMIVSCGCDMCAYNYDDVCISEYTGSYRLKGRGSAVELCDRCFEYWMDGTLERSELADEVPYLIKQAHKKKRH